MLISALEKGCSTYAKNRGAKRKLLCLRKRLHSSCKKSLKILHTAEQNQILKVEHNNNATASNINLSIFWKSAQYFFFIIISISIYLLGSLVSKISKILTLLKCESLALFMTRQYQKNLQRISAGTLLCSEGPKTIVSTCFLRLAKVFGELMFHLFTAENLFNHAILTVANSDRNVS